MSWWSHTYSAGSSPGGPFGEARTLLCTATKAQNVRNDENESLKGPKTVSATFQIHSWGSQVAGPMSEKCLKLLAQAPLPWSKTSLGSAFRRRRNGAPMAAMKKLLAVMAVLFSGLQGSMLDGHFSHQT